MVFKATSLFVNLHRISSYSSTYLRRHAEDVPAIEKRIVNITTSAITRKHLNKRIRIYNNPTHECFDFMRSRT